MLRLRAMQIVHSCVAFFGLGFGVSGPLNGAIAAGFGYASVYLAGAVAAAIGCLVVLSTLRERRSYATTRLEHRSDRSQHP